MVVTIHTDLSALELLKATQRIEIEMGRLAKSGNTYQDRIIDIDIIAYHSEIENANELILPHPHFRKRNFVLYPLAEIAPEWIYPVSCLTAAQLNEQSPDQDLPQILYLNPIDHHSLHCNLFFSPSGHTIAVSYLCCSLLLLE